MQKLKAYALPTYGQRVKIALQYLLPQLPLTRLAGWLAERKWGAVTHFIIKGFVAKYKVDLSEAEKQNPADYATFNEFFIRTLAPNARPICAGTDTLCLPADGKVSEVGKIHHNQLLQAKGHYFTLETLLANDMQLADMFKDGDYLTTYLSPRDYHRVHMPCDGVLTKMIYVPGELYSVNPFLAEHIPNLFARNERLICVFETEFGTMVQILVGATITASMSTQWSGVVNPPRSKEVTVYEYLTEGETAVKLKKGQEMGAFRLGSTVINLFPKGKVQLSETLQAGVALKMGEQLGILR